MKHITRELKNSIKHNSKEKKKLLNHATAEFPLFNQTYQFIKTVQLRNKFCRATTVHRFNNNFDNF